MLMTTRLSIAMMMLPLVMLMRCFWRALAMRVFVLMTMLMVMLMIVLMIVVVSINVVMSMLTRRVRTTNTVLVNLLLLHFPHLL